MCCSAMFIRISNINNNNKKYYALILNTVTRETDVVLKTVWGCMLRLFHLFYLYYKRIRIRCKTSELQIDKRGFGPKKT